jgi:hypothetical protein
MAYALTSKNYFGNLFQWRNAAGELRRIKCNRKEKYAEKFARQSVGLEESKRKCGWVRIDFDDFEGQ